MTAPPRHDFLPSSCVNKEVNSFNRQLKKGMVIYNNVKILDCDFEREHFTKHAVHPNSSGRECIALRLATMVRTFSQQREDIPCLLTVER